MTQRERHTLDEGSAQPALRDASLWGEWYHLASPVQRREALDRAVYEGILYAHQLAVPAASAAPRSTPLSGLLSGSFQELGSLHPPVLDCLDRELDATQRDAVARAIATPDVCLLQGYPGTGKSRVVTEILLQAARRGERILFLAPSTAALDRVLERLGTNPDLCPLRCLSTDESLETLPAGIVRFTLAERLRWYREKTLPAARAARDAARQAVAARLREQSVWVRLEDLSEQEERTAERLRILTERRSGLAAEVDADEDPGSPFHERQSETRQRLDTELAGLRSELEMIAAKQGHLEDEWERIRPLAEARQARRFWTGAWWRAVTHGGLADQTRDLETRRAELRAARGLLEQDIAARLAERTEIEDRYAEECRHRKEAEVLRRQAELNNEIAAVSSQRDALREQWRSACRELAPDSAPAEMSRSALDFARTEWERQRQRDEQQAAAVEQWLQVVEDGLPTLPEKLARCANVVAATTTTLPGDAHFGARNGTPALEFDLLVLEEAHQVTESEFIAAARRARRWVLVGEPQPDVEPTQAPRRLVAPAVLRPGFFQRLWQNLHADPHRLPFVWMQREGRLICRLRPVPAKHPHSIESEPVIDRPDIELRILTTPRQAPQILEVVFPACTSIGEAKQFIFQELDELAVQTRGRALYWSETADEVVLDLAPDNDDAAVTVELAEGVRERVARVAGLGEAVSDDSVFWHTCGLQFARVAGWTREKAESWVGERLGLRNLGRTVLLRVPYRLEPPLARFLSDLLFDGVCEPACTTANVAAAVAPIEFIAVPALSPGEGRHHREADAHRNGGEVHDAYTGHGQTVVSVRAPRLRSVKGGAGLELDLADDRPLEQLPADLRAILPRQGLVNYLEARALLKRLESLVRDGAFRAACERWRQRPAWPCAHGCAVSSAECGCPRPETGPAVAVMALYPAQVELLRHLIRQTPALAECPFPIEVGLPSAFGQRECLLAFVGLTRSHTHRAVSYGDHPHVLAQALTRAASGLVLFGDPGTLTRRSQWHGALDHLDETAAQREGSLVRRIVQYLHGQGRHPAAFHLYQGSGV